MDSKDSNDNKLRCDCLTSNGVDQVEGADGKKYIIYTDDDGIDHEYPTAYGTFCEGWDAPLPPYCASSDGKPFDDPPGWCDDYWCYVDKRNCNLNDMEASSFFESKRDLWYSYANC